MSPLVNADLKSTARRTIVMNLAYEFERFVEMERARRPAGYHPLTSELGIHEALMLPLRAKGNGTVGPFGTTIQFVASYGGKVSAGLALRRVAGPGRTSPMIGLNGTREDDHTLDLTFARLTPEPEPTEVIVVGRRRP